MKKAFLQRRDIMIAGLSAIPGMKVNKPMGAFYLFPDVSALFGKSVGERQIDNAQDFAMYLLEVANVATVGGGAFGTPECIRLSYAASESQLQEALRRISEAVEALH
jgi:aspartate aminotransferase